MATRIPDRQASRAAGMLTATEAARHLGVKLGTLYAYVSRGWLKSYRRRVGRQALYRRDDIDALRGLVISERGRRGRSLPAASTWVTVAQPHSGDVPAPGVIVAESAVSAILEGKIAYRGYPIEELIANASFDEVCLLLWSGERPVAEETAALCSEIAGARLPESVGAALRAVGDDAPAVLRLAAMMPALAAWDRRQPPRTRIDRAKLIISLLPLALGGIDAESHDAQIDRPTSSGMAARMLRRLTPDGAPDWAVAALNRVLVSCAEHELNASTFAARVVASTGADLFASVLAALCSFSGPIHGGPCDRIEEMFAALEAGTSVAKCLEEFSRERRLAPGFGHAIYTEGDPRALLLRSAAEDISSRRGAALFAGAVEVEAAVFKRDRLRPNLDYYLTVCTRMLGFARGMPAAIFAIGRTAGWIAHTLEQYADNRLIRPRMRYRGASLRHWDGAR